MNKHLYLLLILLPVMPAMAQNNQWKIVGDKITTPWAEKVDPENPLPEYPRPQMVRDTWYNLNGLWDYAIKNKDEAQPASFEGKILVPFAVESALSGVGKTVGKEKTLWYKTTFTLPHSMQRNQVLLHFGAVDWEATVFLNGEEAGTHQGGYDPFSFDITAHLKKRGAQELVVKVWDPTDEGPQPCGKQAKNPHEIWYTPVTGIWQTVWLEAVPQTYIVTTKNTPDLDNKTFSVSAEVAHAQKDDQLRVRVLEGKNKIAEEIVAAGEEAGRHSAVLQIANPTLWSPENPHLYDLEIAVLRKNKVVDAVKSYMAMRKISMEPDENGIQRMMLNNEFVFQYGPLDQGWWPDGLYTAPTDKALRFDIEKAKELGFNMIRKHVKVEPARWYHYCDSLGMLVWQDMPSGDMGNYWNPRPGVIMGIDTDRKRTPESEKIYRTEWEAIIDARYNFPSIVVWVPFNEAWGQFKTEEITKWTMEHDPSRLVNCASGGNFYLVGHIIDMHNYPDPVMARPDLFGKKQILVLGEFGGLQLRVEGHTWQKKDKWDIPQLKDKEELMKEYKKLIANLTPLIPKGLSAAVYTQTTDIEDGEVEVCGFLTYDRKVIKFSSQQLRALHKKMYATRIEMGK